MQCNDAAITLADTKAMLGYHYFSIASQLQMFVAATKATTATNRLGMIIVVIVYGNKK